MMLLLVYGILILCPFGQLEFIDQIEQSGDGKSPIDDEMKMDQTITNLEADPSTVKRLLSSRMDLTVTATTNNQPIISRETTIDDKLTTPNTNNLNGDIEEFIQLLPDDQIKRKILEYYRDDGQVRNICNYLMGDEFDKLKQRTLKSNEIKEFLIFFNHHGLDLNRIIEKLQKVFSLPRHYALTSLEPFGELSQYFVLK